jgi:hypothetical protein
MIDHKHMRIKSCPEIEQVFALKGHPTKSETSDFKARTEPDATYHQSSHIDISTHSFIQLFIVTRPDGRLSFGSG